jgi:hypothetical protein
MKINKPIPRILFAVGFVLAALFINAAVFANDTNTQTVWVKNIKVNSTGVSLSGDTGSSAEGFNGFSYRIIGDQLYIKPRYFLGGSGAFDIHIYENMDKINIIYLQGREINDIKIIWEKGAP